MSKARQYKSEGVCKEMKLGLDTLALDKRSTMSSFQDDPVLPFNETE